MFQKFYTDTLGGRFIKSLLAQTPIPLFECVTDGDHLVQGRYYVYKRFIIKCASSGILTVFKSDLLIPGDTLYPSVYLVPGTGYIGATFYVKSYVDSETDKTHAVFKSSTNYYDSETHYHLGRYLRYLYSTQGINLFPYYNVYNSKYFSDIELYSVRGKEVGISRVSSQRYKVVAVPIRFGHTYTVALDCPTQVLMRACIHDNSGFIEESALPTDSNKTFPIQETLEDSGRVFSRMRFDSPVTYRIETNSPSAMMLQHNLYLIIQLPLNNDSSIVVLENYSNKTGVRCNKEHVREFTHSDLSLLKMNTRVSYAFSDRLIEYLLGNVIASSDFIAQNISKVQTAISQAFPDYKMSFLRGKHRKGVWDKDISRFVLSTLEKYKDELVIYDQDGNINKDIESLIYLKGGNY